MRYQQVEPCVNNLSHSFLTAMSEPTPETYRDSLVEDRPDERLPYHWDGPEERCEGVFLPRVFIGSGYNTHTEPGDEREVELALLFTGRAPMHPEDFTQTWVCHTYFD